MLNKNKKIGKVKGFIFICAHGYSILNIMTVTT